MLISFPKYVYRYFIFIIDFKYYWIMVMENKIYTIESEIHWHFLWGLLVSNCHELLQFYNRALKYIFS